jgi:hypothetical protein
MIQAARGAPELARLQALLARDIRRQSSLFGCTLEELAFIDQGRVDRGGLCAAL